MKFTHNPNVNSSGTSLQGYVRVAPAELVEMFGEPGEGDEYKVSMEYTFKGSDGSVVTLYDWKATSLYDEGCPDPKDFRGDTAPNQFHVGARHGSKAATLFIAWMHECRRAHIARPSAQEPAKGDCSECHGTREYVGFRGFKEPCRTCC